LVKKQTSSKKVENNILNKSSWSDSIFGKVRIESQDTYFENVSTKISNKISRYKKLYHIVKNCYKIIIHIRGPFHVLPDFLILASGASGTTSMMELYLQSNKYIKPSKTNEIFYFDKKYYNHVNWYKIFFPTIFEKFFQIHILKKKFIVGEDTGKYLLHHQAPKRVKETIPNAKFIVMMRNPIDRSFSNYKRQIRNGKQKLTFEESINIENNTVQKELDAIKKDENYHGQYLAQAYLTRSKYVNALERWFEFFPKEQFLFINTDDYFKNPIYSYHKILEFLNLPKHTPKITGKRGISQRDKSKDTKLKPETQKYLKEYFKPYNEKLFKLINERYDWD